MIRRVLAKGADTLLQMARDALAGRTGEGAAGENYQVTLHVDAAALCGNGSESDLPQPTVKRLCCDGAVTTMAHDAAARSTSGASNASCPAR